MSDDIIRAMAAMWVAYQYEREYQGRAGTPMVVGKVFEGPHFRGNAEYGRTKCGRYWEKQWSMLSVQPQHMCRKCIDAILAQYEVVAE